MVTAASVIPSDRIGVLGSVPKIQVAISMVVAIGLIVPGAAEPPCRTIRRPPSLLIPVATVHWMLCATSATILGAGDINDEMWGPERTCGLNERVPIGPASR